METIRCLIADIPHHLLADIIQKTTETRPEIKVIDQVDNSEDILDILEKDTVDTLILGMGEGFESCLLDKIFTLMPQVVVIGVIDNGRRVCMYLEDVGPKLLMDLICLKKSGQ